MKRNEISIDLDNSLSSFGVKDSYNEVKRRLSRTRI